MDPLSDVRGNGSMRKGKCSVDTGGIVLALQSAYLRVHVAEATQSVQTRTELWQRNSTTNEQNLTAL